MSDRNDEPTDLFDAICRLDDLADWLEADYFNEAAQIRVTSDELKAYIVISLPVKPARGAK